MSAAEDGSEMSATASHSAADATSASLFPFSDLQLTCPVVGRRHYSAQPQSSRPQQGALTAFLSGGASDAAAPSHASNLSAGCPLMLLREPHNPRDPDAIKVLSTALPTPAVAAIGHLPARLAAALAPLLDLHALLVLSAAISYTAPTAEDPSDEPNPAARPASPVGSLDQPLYAMLVLAPNGLFVPAEHGEYADRIRRHVSDLLQYAEWSRVDHTHRFIDNFALVSTSCLSRFPHLFTAAEQAMVRRFQALSRPAQHLYCRLMARKQSPSALMAAVVAAVPSTVQGSAASAACARWFQVSSLHYRHVDDLAAALAELRQPAERSEQAETGGGAARRIDEVDSDLPPLLTSPCKYASAASAATYASIVPSSPFSASKYPPLPNVEDVDDEETTASPFSVTAGSLKVVRKLQLHHGPRTEQASKPQDSSAVPTILAHSPGFVETSDSSSLSRSELWSSLFESMTVKQVRELCAKLDVRLRSSSSSTTGSSSSSASTLRSTVLATMQKQRTLSGRCMLDDPRMLACLHSMHGQWVRLHSDFLTLCQRLYRLFFLSEDVSHSSIASAQSPMMLEDLGKAKWCKPVAQPPASPASCTASEPEATAGLLFPSRCCFVAWDVSLQLMDVMSYAVDDFEAELRAGYLSVPLALSCLEEGWERLQYEREHENESWQLHWRVVERLEKMKAVAVAASKTAHLFPHDYHALLELLSPHPTATGSPPHLPASSASPAGSATPSFMLRFRASTSYASVCHYGVAVLERLHRYDEACCLLVNLLQLPYCPARRGEWWNRLSIDLATNLKHKKRAMAACQLALQDEHVRTGDRVELQRRWDRLWRDKEGGNGEGLAPAVSSYCVPQPSTAKRRGSDRGNSKAAAKRAQAGARHHGKKRRFSTPAAPAVKQEDTQDDHADILHRSSSSPSSSPSDCPDPSPHPLLPASSSRVSQTTIQGRPTNRAVGDKSRLFGYDGAMCSVEELALQWYGRSSAEGGGGGGCWKGMHCENALFMTLFALLMWDVLFLPLPLAFPCLYQSAPLDLDDDSFYAARQPAIAAQLGLLASHPSLRDYLSRQWWRHHGERCRGLHWRRWRIEELQEIVECMGAQAVAGVMGVMARDYAHWSGGLPDLFLWRTERELQMDRDTRQADGAMDRQREQGGRPAVKRKLHMRDEDVIVISSDDDEVVELSEAGEKKREPCAITSVSASCVARVKLVEVKGPRDRLSAQQLAWLHALAPFVDVEVCYVRENAET